MFWTNNDEVPEILPTKNGIPNTGKSGFWPKKRLKFPIFGNQDDKTSRVSTSLMPEKINWLLFCSKNIWIGKGSPPSSVVFPREFHKVKQILKGYPTWKG